MALCLRPSVTSRSFIETDKRIELIFGTGLPSTCPTPCYKDNGTFLWNFVPNSVLTLDLDAAFATASQPCC